ncbi:TetR/AcrR family transcriptional regulator [Paracoccus jiaweipingae]|uniref:TetR/AcrR family transcriptional regulator n=1 Tax=unclassified Paracoccus (in: a-proteobacteria) TaxID=2688777 RepID=UPI00378CDFED
MSDPSRSSIGARRNPQTETAILDAAERLIEQVGFQKLSIEAVAREARAGKATVYRWWPGKGHLLLALYSRAKTALPEPDTGDMRRDLEEYLTQFLQRLNGTADSPPLAPLLRLLIAEAQSDPAMHAAFRHERDERWDQITSILRRARDRGQLNPALSPDQAARRIVSMIWLLLLDDALPASDAAPALLDELMPALHG